MDPGLVPPELQGLTQVEEMLISVVMPMMSLYRLLLGQHGYSGHVVNLPQDVSSFVTSLLWLPSDIDVILVHKEGATRILGFVALKFSVLCSGCNRKTSTIVTSHLTYRPLLNYQKMEICLGCQK